MKVEEQYLDALQNIESGIMRVFRADPSILDLDAKDAVAALMRHYRAAPLAGKSQARLKPDSSPVTDADEDAELGPAPAHPNTLDDIGICLNHIRKSIDFWNKRNGRQGYLYFVAQYVA